MSTEKYLSETALNGVPQKKLNLMLRDGAVDADKIKDMAVTEKKLSSSSVSWDKLTKEVQEQILGTGGDVYKQIEEIKNNVSTLQEDYSSCMDDITTVQGDISDIQNTRVENYIGEISSDAELDKYTTTGFFVYDKGTSRFNLVVQNYPDKWCIQYQFTANNINRRYYDYANKGWTPWKTIGQVGYDPNADYLATAGMIKNGLPDSQKVGLRVGDVINGRYVGFSEYDLCYMHDKSLKERLDAPADTTYDLTDESTFPDSSAYKSYDSAKGCWWWNGNLNLSWGGSDGKVLVYINIHSIYDDTTINDQSVKQGWNTIWVDSSNGTITLKSGNYVWTDTIEIYSSASLGFEYISSTEFKVYSGNTAGLINAFKFAYDGLTINIPAGIYNVGCLDATDWTGILNAQYNDMTIKGEGKDVTIITGHYLNKYSMIKCALANKGARNTFEGFTIISKHLGNMNLQAPAVQDAGADSIWKNCAIIGSQDTLYLSKGSHLYYKCWIEGTVDFIFGGDTDSTVVVTDIPFRRISLFKDCDIRLKGRAVGNVICAPAGMIAFTGCNIDNNDNYEYDQENQYGLARAWQNNCIVAFHGTQLKTVPSDSPYSTMSSDTKFYVNGDTKNTDVFGNDMKSYDELCVGIGDEVDKAITTPATIKKFFDDTSRLDEILNS